MKRIVKDVADLFGEVSIFNANSLCRSNYLPTHGGLFCNYQEIYFLKGLLFVVFSLLGRVSLKQLREEYRLPSQ